MFNIEVYCEFGVRRGEFFPNNPTAKQWLEQIPALVKDTGFAHDIEVSVHPSECRDRKGRDKPYIRICGTNRKGILMLVQAIRKLGARIETLKLSGSYEAVDTTETHEEAAKDLKALKAEDPVLAGLFSRLRSILADRLEIRESKIHIDSSFRQDLGADSLDTYELIYAIEEELGMSIPDETANKFETVRDGLEYIRSHADKKELARFAEGGS